ncbi:MAG: NADH:ubiquinone reductase (Na(+)-transporting) subunit C [Aureispira sp.]|nr:NADH:ubiquinone reductase (Na(+)-transporting) subunit C [Aureispira sp.]
MKKEQNIYLYVVQLTIVIAAVLAGLYNVLDPIYKQNRNAAKKEAILKCVPIVKEAQLASVADVDATFKTNIEAIAIKPDGTIFKTIEEVNAARPSMQPYESFSNIDLGLEEKIDEKDRVYPVYIYKQEGGNYYVVTVRGNGLWDKIWAFVALEADLNTIAGIDFGHVGETPGLGAEIKDSKSFKDQFIGLKVFKGDNVALTIQKKGIKDKDHDVAVISGATVTCNGANDMFRSGFNHYKAYFSKVN